MNEQLYKLLNEVELDEKEFTQLEVNDIEKAKFKNQLKQRIVKKKRKRMGRVQAVVVASLVMGISATLIGLAYPAYAGSIPIVRDIFKFIDGDRAGLYENYKQFSTAIGISEKSKGVEITINDAIYDGESIVLTYSIQSERPLGENPFLHDVTSSLKDANGMTWGSETTKVDDHNYVGMLTIGNFGQDVGDTAHLVWDINSIVVEETDTRIKGNWRFAVSVDATEQHSQQVHKSLEEDGIKVSIEQITETPMSVIVYARQQIEQKVLEKWDHIDLDFTMTDDVGNVYEGVGLGSRGEVNDLSTGKTFGKIDDRATKLTIVPHLRLVAFSTTPGEQKEEINSFGESVTTTSTTEAKDFKEFTLEPITIELQK
ncbi:DUF4179 domain-containing protein [Paenibacillus sp. GCM10028914]|uniref:DUF4179 domain-containing protein n=1 Tax=Paenibacillus sp. GCM10028914 TaxID=3273416 RepID=UPI00360D289F